MCLTGLLSSRPEGIAENTLSMGQANPQLPSYSFVIKDGKTYLGNAHMAIHKKTWPQWEPQLLLTSTATDEELAPYRAWNRQMPSSRIKLTQ